MSTLATAPATAQLTFATLLYEQAEGAWQRAGLPRTYRTLKPGDVVEIQWREGSVVTGWAAMRHPVDGVWQVQVQADSNDAPGTPQASSLYGLAPWPPYVLLLRNSVWRCIRHDATWQLGPDPAVVGAWMREQTAGLPHDRWYQVYHEALAAWPTGVDPAWRQAAADTFTALAQEQIPVAAWLKAQRKASGAGSTLWSYPRSIQRRIEREIWPLAGPDRWSAILALRWTRGEQFGDCVGPEGQRAFNRHGCTIYAGYLRWAVEHAASPRQLLELLDVWGSNPAPEEAQV